MVAQLPGGGLFGSSQVGSSIFMNVATASCDSGSSETTYDPGPLADVARQRAPG